MSLLPMFARRRAAAKFLDGRIGYAVGDIHGCADLLDLLLNEIETRARDDVREAGPPILIFLGDYVDRGPDSKGVINLLLSGRPSNCERRYLRGNHEQAMVAFMADASTNRRWLVHGGAETMLSYGTKPPSFSTSSDTDWAAASAALTQVVPAEHVAFLNALERYIILGDYAFVHAGVEVTKTLEEQTDNDLYWSRERWLGAKRRFSHKVVHGHTPTEQPHHDERRVGVDTGAYASGVLTAARFEGEAVTFFNVSSGRRGNRPPGTKAKKSRF